MQRHLPVLVFFIGSMLASMSIFCHYNLFPQMFEKEVHKNIDLVKGSFAFDTWRKQPFPIKFIVYLFNVSNADEVQNGAKPILKETGPYVYDQFIEKTVINVDKNKDTILYSLKKEFVFNQNESGSLTVDDDITIINAAVVGTALQVYNLLPTMMPTVSEAIPYLFPGIKDIFMRAKVKDILFDGIKLHCQDPAVDFICGAMKQLLPVTMRVDDNGKDIWFSMFGHLNGTDDGLWEVERGLNNSTTRGETHSYKNQSILEFWGDEYCNQINGSDSTIFEPVSKKKVKKRLYTFVPEICRSMYANYESEGSELGVSVLRYSIGEDAFDNSEENKCFCPSYPNELGDLILTCPPKGLADITPCIRAPILVSNPHFYLADESLREYASGLDPKKELHASYVYLEPITATPISGRRRVQMNIEVKKLEGFELLENVTHGIFPFLWLEEGATLPPEFVEIVSANLAKRSILTAITWGLLVLGCIFMTSHFIVLAKRDKIGCFAHNSTIDVTIPQPQNDHANINTYTRDDNNGAQWKRVENAWQRRY